MLSSSVFTACKKESMDEMREKFKLAKENLNIKPNNSMFGGQCMNDNDHTPSKVSPYQVVRFRDDFGPGKTGPCYTMKPKCDVRLDWWMGGDCPFDEKLPQYAGLKDLNKCAWKPWHGGSTNKDLVSRADAVEVSGGTLKLKVLANPDYNPSKGNCGDEDTTLVGNRNMNCKLMAGSVDSKYHDSSMKGASFLYGRIEMRARFTTTTGHASYPALWTWNDTIGKGYPDIAHSAQEVPHPSGLMMEPKYIGEIDILESDGSDTRNYGFQSYHHWPVGTKINAFTSKGRTLNMSEWHTYGAEWSPGSVKFYIDGCYTHEVKNGDKSQMGDHDIPYIITDTSSFIMMNVFTSGKPIDLNNRDIFEVDEVTVYGTAGQSQW